MANVRFDDNFKAGMLAESDDAERTPSPLRADPTTKRLKVDSNSADGAANVGDGNGSVTTAGTAVQLPNVSCRRVKIICSEWNGDTANCPNGGIIVVGGSSVVAALATRRGIPLYPTQSEWFYVSNLSLLFVDSLDDGAKYHYEYEN